MRGQHSLCVFLVIFLLIEASISATIIITPYQKTTLKMDSSGKTTNSYSITDSTILVEIIKQYFGCYKFVNGICLKCKDDYFVNQDGKCSRISQNCLDFNIDQGICVQCKQNFYIVDGICYSKIQTTPLKNHCTIWSEKQCLRCQKSYYLSESFCKPIELNCRNWSFQGICSKCKTGYSLNQQSKCILTQKYKKCQSNTYLSQKYSCQSLPLNCETYDSFNGKCVNCFPQFILNQSFSCICPQKAYCFNQHCIKYSSQNKTVCLICQKGYILNGKGNCILEPKKQEVIIPTQKPKQLQKLLPKQCLQWNINKTACAKCNQKWILNNINGQCILQVQNCIQYSKQGECATCNDSYELIQKSCHIKALPMDSSELYGCENWNFNTSKCSSCHQNFAINKQQICIYNEDHCLQRNQKDFCLKCKDGYNVISGNCQVKSQVNYQTKVGCKMFDWVNNNCLVCQDDYIKTQKGTCERPIQNCIVKNQTGQNCKKCLINYDLVNGKCQAYSTTKCIEKSEDGKCIRCSDSYALLNGQCKTFKQLGTVLLDYYQYSPQKLRQKITVFTNEIKY